MESILTSVKKSLGIVEEYTHFDADIIMHINSVLSILTYQLGVGPSEGFTIAGKTENWSSFLPDDKPLDLVKSYVCLKVRLLFDPPQSGILTGVIEKQLSELEWRISIAAE